MDAMIGHFACIETLVFDILKYCLQFSLILRVIESIGLGNNI